MIIFLARSVILYFFVIFSLRLMGKRQIGELQPSELVVTFLVSELATLPMQDANIPILISVIPIVTLVFLEHMTSYLCLKSVRIRRCLNGNPCIVIKDGKIDIKTLRALRMSVDEILEELRVNNITEISSVKYAIIETSGQLSYILYPKDRNVTLSDLKLTSKETCVPFIVVNDGFIINKSLIELEKDKKWLINHLKNVEKVNLEDIFLMTVDSNDNVFLQKREGLDE
ncbi:MAG: DUF421 domain-containing protein [Clostridia bacterium]